MIRRPRPRRALATPIALACALAASIASSGCARSIEARGHGWWRARTEHVELETDGGRAHTESTAIRLEQLHRALAVAFFRCPTVDHARVVRATQIVVDEEALEVDPDGRSMFLHEEDGLLPWDAGIFLHPGTDRWDGRQTMAHEIVHGLVADCFPDAPTWLHEGLAETFETVDVRDGRVVIGPPPLRLGEYAFGVDVFWEAGVVVLGLSERSAPRPSQLVRMRYDEFHAGGGTAGTTEAGNYASACLLTRMLALGPDRALRSRFLAYLETLMRGGEAESVAFDVAFDGVDLDAPFTRYVRAQQFITPERGVLPGDPIEVSSEPMTPADAHLRIAELHHRIRGRGAAERALPHVEIAEADPAAIGRAALLRAVLGPRGEEDARVRDAWQRASHDRDVLRARLLVAYRAREDDVLRVLAPALGARDDLRVADLVLLARLANEEARAAEALDFAERATRLDRSAASAWLELGVARERSGDRAGARAAIRRAANLTAHHAPSTSRWARTWLERHPPRG